MMLGPMLAAGRARPLLLAALASVALVVPAAGQTSSMTDAPMPPSFLRAMEPMVPRDAATSAVVVTRHHTRINGRGIPYRAIVTETPLADAKGQPAVVAVSYGYVADLPGIDAAARPVAFVFNGGPGASSSPLHLHAFAPVRQAGTGDTAHMERNPHSLLDVADLVFIDPPGTGASMPVKGGDPSGFFSVGGDARAVWAMIDAWKQANGRTRSPTILIGESYGTMRASAMLTEALKADRPLPQAVVLLAPSLGGDFGAIFDAVNKLPTFAAVAWYHQAVPRNGRTVAQVFDEAQAFAETDYVLARARGSRLSAAEKARVAGRLSALIGLPAAQIAAVDLHLDNYPFMLSLLAGKGLRTGQLDARATRAISASNLRPPFDDPSMTLGVDGPAMAERYLRDQLGYTLPSPYRSLNLGINFGWTWDKDYGGSYQMMDFGPQLARALKQSPAMRLFMAGGYYDITTPLRAGRFALEQAQIPPDRVIVKAYPAGHSIFEDEDSLAQLAADLRQLIRDLPPAD